MKKEDYAKIVHSIPKQPGVYRFMDEQNEILYIGKAKNLRKRLDSYFSQRKDFRRKTKIMVKNATHIDYTLVDTEQDALLLEATLIQKYQPRYNVMLKSGKPYPYICIKKERFPRVFITRNVIKDGSKYFGPYVSRYRINNVLELIRNLFKLRTCNYNLSEENIKKGKFKPCLEFHIKNCEAPCVDLESESAYDDKIRQISNLLRGHFGSVKKYLKEQMQYYAENMQFELAQDIKNQYDAIHNYQGKSTVVNPSIRDVDVFCIDQDEDLCYINYIKVVEGAIINTFTIELDKNLDNDEPDLLFFGIKTLRDKFNSIAPEIIVPFDVSAPSSDTKVTVPQIGDKKKLLELSQKNLQYFVLQKKKQATVRQNKKTSTEKVLEIMKSDLQMDVLPMHIECFDNSNFQGSNPVAAMVCFKNTKPAKREYRHFHIKTVEGPNDFASMQEIVYRRYFRLLETNKPLPQLIIIDGGKGQLSAAVESLKALNLEKRITIIGIAKKLEEIYFPDDKIPLLLSKKSPTLKVIQHARNEAHRFAIEFHKLIRSKKFIQTQLTSIPGVGTKTADNLLSHFGSVESIKTKTEEEIATLVGPSIAKKIIDYFKDPQNTLDSYY